MIYLFYLFTQYFKRVTHLAKNSHSTKWPSTNILNSLKHMLLEKSKNVTCTHIYTNDESSIVVTPLYRCPICFLFGFILYFLVVLLALCQLLQRLSTLLSVFFLSILCRVDCLQSSYGIQTPKFPQGGCPRDYH